MRSDLGNLSGCLVFKQGYRAQVLCGTVTPLDSFSLVRQCKNCGVRAIQPDRRQKNFLPNLDSANFLTAVSYSRCRVQKASAVNVASHLRQSER